MNYWLKKSEAGTFGINDLVKAPAKTTAWDGSRNHQVRNMLWDRMHEGDEAFFYHSSCIVPGMWVSCGSAVALTRIARHLTREIRILIHAAGLQNRAAMPWI